METPPIPGVTFKAVPLQIDSRRAVVLRIQDIVLDTKAEVASLLRGDVIIGIDGEVFSRPGDSQDRLEKGGLVHLEFFRDAKPVTREVVILLGPLKEGRLSAAA